MKKNNKQELFCIELRNPYTMILAGPTRSGKTTFVENVLKNAAQLYSKEPNNFFYFYNLEEPTHEELRKIVTEFIEGLPDKKWLKDVYEEYGENVTVIIDDQALNINKEIAELFSVGSSRKQCNVIFITQNLFGKQKEARDISINCNYVVLFKNPGDQVSAQMFFRRQGPGKAKILFEIYEDATQKPFSYLFIDMQQETHDMDRYLANIFSENKEPPVLYRF